MEEFLLLLLILFPKRLQCQEGSMLSNIVEEIERNALPSPNEYPVKNLNGKVFDYIVVGAGPAGCALAARLSEMSRVSVLLLEAGDEENGIGEIPLFNEAMILSQYNWMYKMEKEEGVCLGGENGQCIWPAGKGLGGGSLINAMIYARGDPSDYDAWAAKGNEDWSYAKCLPYFLKSEDMAVEGMKHSPYHSTGGPVHISYPPYETKLMEAFMEAANEVGLKNIDYNDPKSRIGVSRIQATMTNGRRWSAARAYLKPAQSRKNLTINKRSLVTKVLIRNGQAYGVEVLVGGSKGKAKRAVIFAREEIIISAGAFKSPQLLMLSGIGPKSHLESHGISVVKDLHVGDNLQEHLSMAGLSFMVNDSLSGLFWNRPFAETASDFTNWLMKGKGVFSMLGCEGLGYVKTKYASKIPDVEYIFVPASLGIDCGILLRRGMGLSKEFFDKEFSEICGVTSWSIWPMLLYPKSKGTVRLRSKDPLDPPLIHGNFLHDKKDLDVLVEALKLIITLSKTNSFRRYGSELYSKPISGCAGHKFLSDEYLGCTVRYITTQLHHQCGTCKMGPEWDNEAVVDSRLRVRGIVGLRVADTSIMPSIVGGHTMAAAYMIGEKAAAILKEDLHSKYGL